jgi:cytochrome b
MNPTVSSAASPPSTGAATRTRLRVWDLPTRLFHWALAGCVIGAVVTAKVGGNAMVWHFRLGVAVMALLVFRLLWGVLGGHWSRFGTFFYGPGALWRYLRGQPAPGDRFDWGHSPLGSLSVWALLAVLAVQVATGLVADDEIANVGPLNRFVAAATASAATGWHKSAGQWLVIVLAVLHVVAVFAYLLVKRRNLIGPMLHGDQWAPAGHALPASQDGLGQRLLALALALGCAGLAVWVLQQ